MNSCYQKLIFSTGLNVYCVQKVVRIRPQCLLVRAQSCLLRLLKLSYTQMVERKTCHTEICIRESEKIFHVIEIHSTIITKVDVNSAQTLCWASNSASNLIRFTNSSTHNQCDLLSICCNLVSIY